MCEDWLYLFGYLSFCRLYSLFVRSSPIGLTFLMFQMAGRHTRSGSTGHPGSSNAEDTIEGRFNKLMQAFVTSQEAQTQNQSQQREDQATFQTQMMAVLERPAPIAQVIMPARVTDPNDVFDKFKKRNPPEFYGNEDPLDADEWVVQVEKIFEVFRCTGRERVQLAAYMLRGTAEMWWKSVKTPYVTIDDEVAWESFSTLFRTKFIPPHITALKIAEFETLQQGEDSVQFYEQRFTNLSRFAPSLVKTEADKVMRFIRGLNPNIKEMVTGVTLAIYEENLKRAYWAEESIREKAAYNQTIRQSQTQSKAPTGYQQQYQQRPQQQYQQRTQQSQQQAKRPRFDQSQTQGQRLRCVHCGKNHPSTECRVMSGACFECGLQGHQVKDCPKKQGQGVRSTAPRPPLAAQPLRQAPQQQQQLRLPAPPQGRGQFRPHGQQGQQRPQGFQQEQHQRYQHQRPQQHGRLNALDTQEGEDIGGVVEGTLSISDVPARVLFDSGSTHSFVSPIFAACLVGDIAPLPYLLLVSTPLGRTVQCESYFPACRVRVGDLILSAALIILGMKDFDVILGMDWLSTYRAVMDCFNKTIRLQVLASSVEIVGERRPISTSVISALRADRLIRSGCEGYVAFITEDKSPTAVADIPVACEFPDVFPEEIPGLPPVREIDFTIELMPGTAPISKAPYRMAPAELRELKAQLQDLLDKGFVRPSVSPWGAPVIFVKKKDGTMRMCIDYR